MKKKHAGT